MKVVDPKGKDQIKLLKYDDMMKSYDAYFSLPEKGSTRSWSSSKLGTRRKQQESTGYYVI